MEVVGNFAGKRTIDNENPWITKVGRDSVICRVDWTECDACVLHMGDEQWDAIESIFKRISDTQSTSNFYGLSQ